MIEPPTDPEKRAAYEAACVVAPHFQLDPFVILAPSTRHAVVGARRVAWLVLHDVLKWNTERISDVTAFARPTVARGIEAVRAAKKTTPLGKIRDACLAEAAGGER